MNLDERIKAIAYSDSQPDAATMLIEQLIGDVLDYVKPEPSATNLHDAETDSERWARLAFKDFENKLIAQMEAKIKELGL